MSRVIHSYPIPFVGKITMPAHWARWLSGRGFKNPALFAEAEALNAMTPVTWDFARHGKAPWMQFFYDWRFADLDGDGQIDFLLTGGAQVQIAFHQDGRILWEYHDETAGFMDIRLDSNFPVAEHLVCARKVNGALNLCLVNVRDGELVKSIPYPGMDLRPNDYRGSILFADLSGVGSPTDILVSWDYHFIAAYDRDLNFLWQRELTHESGRAHITMGHTPFTADLDGDGRDEILAGSCLLDHDGKTLWVAPDLPALVRDKHADSVRIAALDDGEPPRLLMSTGGYCFSLNGELLWGHDELKHGQAMHIGKIRADVAGKQVIIYEAASRIVEGALDKVIAFDKNGAFLWEYAIQQPDMQEGGFGFWLGDWDGDGLDEVFINDPHKVNILNGRGEVIETLPGHLIYVFDLFGDSRVEAVTLDEIAPGMKLNIITNDAVNFNPTTNALITHRKTTRAMFNCTRY